MPQKEDLSFLFEADKRSFVFSSVISLIKTQKWIIIPSLLGLVFLSLALAIAVRLPREKNDVIFTNSASASSEIAIHIDVEGEVEKPGLYKLKNGDRVEEALIAAGGLGVNADREWIAKKLNRAKVLTDGDKIYVPAVEEIGDSKTGDSKTGEEILGLAADLININDATTAQLDLLPGVGEVTAQKIISGRPYDKIEDLKTKKIVGNSTFEKIKNLITAN